jgi:hypothetical protein
MAENTTKLRFSLIIIPRNEWIRPARRQVS